MALRTFSASRCLGAWHSLRRKAEIAYVSSPFRKKNRFSSKAGPAIYANIIISSSEVLICSWVGLEILVDPFSLATTAEIRVRSTLLADIQFRYPLAFCCSADSGAQ